MNPNQILGMGADDINVTHGERSIEIQFDGKLEYDYPESLIRKSKEPYSNKNYPEVVVARREQKAKEIKPGTFGGKIMPDYVCGSIDDIEYLKEFARSMKTNTIIQIDDEAYQNREYRKENSMEVKREQTTFMNEIEEIIKKDEER